MVGRRIELRVWRADLWGGIGVGARIRLRRRILRRTRAAAKAPRQHENGAPAKQDAKHARGRYCASHATSTLPLCVMRAR
ncbi:MAG: hypothetical protein AMXMBFR56_82630 [Polyangiaceae bacterium]